MAKLDLSDLVRKAVIAVAAGNQVVNNYLKHEELQTRSKELAECKDDACRQGVEKKWSDVSQQR